MDELHVFSRAELLLGKDKLDKLQDLAHREELKIVVQDYLKKCKEILGEE